MILKHVLKDLSDQEAIIQFQEVSSFCKISIEDSKNWMVEDIDEKCFEVEILYQNSRRTSIFCRESVYNEFSKAHDRYIEWLEKNPDLQQSRIDFSMMNNVIQESIKSSVDGVKQIGEEIRKNLIEMNKELVSELLKNDQKMMAQYHEKMKIMDERIESFNRSADSINNIASVLQTLVPNELINQNKEIDNSIKSLEEKIKE